MAGNFLPEAISAENGEVTSLVTKIKNIQYIFLSNLLFPFSDHLFGA